MVISVGIGTSMLQFKNILKKPIETYAIGMELDAIDLKYAKEVADYIGSNHHEIIINKEDVVNAIRPVIKSLATYDITTIRASRGEDIFAACGMLAGQHKRKTE